MRILDSDLIYGLVTLFQGPQSSYIQISLTLSTPFSSCELEFLTHLKELNTAEAMGDTFTTAFINRCLSSARFSFVSIHYSCLGEANWHAVCLLVGMHSQHKDEVAFHFYSLQGIKDFWLEFKWAKKQVCKSVAEFWDRTLSLVITYW